MTKLCNEPDFLEVYLHEHSNLRVMRRPHRNIFKPGKESKHYVFGSCCVCVVVGRVDVLQER